MARAVSSTSSRARIQAALAFLTQHTADAELTIVAASRGAADELARALVAARGATFGVSRYGFNELVARLAAPVLARARVAPASPLSLEAVAARASFEQADDLRYFEPVARMPGFPRSVARTLGELALAGVEAGRLAALGDSGADLADLERGLRAETERSGLVGRADVLRAASAAVATSSLVAAGRPLVLLDVPIDGPLETALVGALLVRAGSALFTVAADDRATTDALKTLDVPVDARARWRRRRRARTAGHVPVLDRGAAGGRGRRVGAAVLRPWRGPGVPGDRPPNPAACRGRRALRRDGRPRPVAAAVHRPARTRLRACRRACLVRSGDTAARSGRPGVARAAGLRERGSLRSAVCRVPVARAGADLRRDGGGERHLGGTGA